ncbi:MULTISPECIES: universal stress protein [unclassified Streptomyces]|uniref:universal stress protein n=1 Tax=unclassified Streptomyces TaxID=2593676 RepID=UPI0015878F1E|nr:MULTISPECIES: universal stress protein [unclassified Streptomyces]NUV68752.1 universal stress protein [Streptomyces sp. CAI-121]NUV98739.1 universal stress protein [Streptomyces sp. CAI 127]NUW14894.1 universal stress protein [Streptomyces sp. CAI-68]
MTRHVTVGLDESPESRAAALWAAREAARRGAALRLMHVEEWPITPEIPLTSTQSLVERYETLLRETADRARRDRPGLEVTTELVQGRAVEELTRAANEAEVTVLGSRGLGGVVGFLVGSVSLGVIGKVRSPVVLVRRPEEADAAVSTEAPADTGARIVLGVDLDHPCDALLSFAFGQADRGDAALQVVHSWALPPAYGYAAILDPGVGSGLGQRAAEGLTELLRPWRAEFPRVEVVEKAVMGPAADELVRASREAGLVVVGRRGSRALGFHIGHVAHAVIHHSTAPVAVVPFE